MAGLGMLAGILPGLLGGLFGGAGKYMSAEAANVAQDRTAKERAEFEKRYQKEFAAYVADTTARYDDYQRTADAAFEKYRTSSDSREMKRLREYEASWERYRKKQDRSNALYVDRVNNQSQDQTHITTGNLSKLVADAEAAGFNPLSVLRAGGLSMYSTTEYRMPKMIARMEWSAPGAFNPGQYTPPTFVAPFGGIEPSMGYGPMTYQGISPWGEALQAFGGGLAGMDLVGGMQADFQSDLAKAQADALRRSGKSSSFAGSVSAASPTRFVQPAWQLGQPQPPQPGQKTVTNPWYSMPIDPRAADAETFQTRYGDSEIASTIWFLKTIAADGWTMGKEVLVPALRDGWVKSGQNPFGVSPDFQPFNPVGPAWRPTVVR